MLFRFTQKSSTYALPLHMAEISTEVGDGTETWSTCVYDHRPFSLFY